MIPTITEQFETNLEQTFFSIDEKQSALILTLLRNNIYSNPLLSAFKESVSNSLDEHVKYDIKKPIDIILPNTFSSNLSIRDYAKGISKDFMLNDYTKVGLSTKNGDNTCLGGLGLGRMSPLSYADLYTVISITEDIVDNNCVRYKRNYVISKDNNKVFCSLLLEEETEEDTGVLVSFEIATKDFNVLKDYVSDTVKYITKTAINIDKVPAIIVKYKEEYKSFRCFAGGNYKGFLIGLIGGLPNIIKLDSIRDNISSDDYEYINSRLSGNNIIFDIGIGQVDQSADKNIQLSERSKCYIASVLTVVAEDFRELVEIRTKDIIRFTDVCKFLKDNNLFSSYITWKDKTFDSNSWLKNCISYNKHRKNYKSRSHDSAYRLSYYSGNIYYYNDLNYEPTIKELLTVYEDLNKTVVVNNIDNTYYNLELLSSSGLSIDRPPSKIKIRKTAVNKNTKCNRMSKYPGEIGRQLNVDLTVENVYISNLFFNNILDETLKDYLFNYVREKIGYDKDIYIVNDVSIVKDVWIDLIDHIKDTYKEISTNYFYYHNTARFSAFSLSTDRDKFINDNPNHLLTKFLIEVRKFSEYDNKGGFIRYLDSRSVIKFKDPSFLLSELEKEIKTSYPLFKSGNLRFSSQETIDYIKLVDDCNFYSKLYESSSSLNV